MSGSAIGSIDDAFTWSISKLARAFRLHRQTVRKRLTDGGVVPTGRQGGTPTYDVRDAAQAILGPEMRGPEEGDDIDPNRLMPRDRHYWFSSERERINLEKELARLVPDDDVRREYAALAKQIAAFLDQVPDVLERDAGVDPAQLEQVEKTLDTMRDSLYQQVIDDDGGEG